MSVESGLSLDEPIVFHLEDTLGNKRRLVCTTTDSGLIRYSLTARSGVPLSLQYLHHDAIALLPSLAKNGWQDRVWRAIIDMPGAIIMDVER